MRIGMEWQLASSVARSITSDAVFVGLAAAACFSLVATATHAGAPGRLAASPRSTILSSPPSPQGIFAPADSSVSPLENDGQPIEVGMRFHADTQGIVTGARFYKQAGNNGVHIAHLWSASGALLAEAHYIDETDAGWQAVSFPVPVAIAAGASYTVSCFSVDGSYSATPNYFTTELKNGLLTVPADQPSAGNGVYAYAPSPTFPALSWEACNYWVDVMYIPSTAPVVLLTEPAADATDAPVPADLWVRFATPLDPATAHAGTFELFDSLGQPVVASVFCDSLGRTVALRPAAPLALSSPYTARLRGGEVEPVIRDAQGVALAQDFTWSFTTAATARPEAPGWVAGDPHVHRSCGGTPVSLTSIREAMVAEDIDIVSLLADMGNGEVQHAPADLPQVNALDAPVSTPGRIVHWDAEWHWDAVYSQYAHQALGGHVLALGLSEAHTLWSEATSTVFDWAHEQGGVAGFAHMQYLDDGLPQQLSCCAPIEYPVEVALGAADFISEDVNGSDTAIHHYYRLLNCGFKVGFAAGSDYPCESSIGRLLTYAETPGGALDYRSWIDAIARGRTVVSRNGRNEFVALRVNGVATPGDEVALAAMGEVQVSATWTSRQPQSRTIELVCNGVVVASKECSASPGSPDSLTATIPFSQSGWLCARVMGEDGHVLHTGAVTVLVGGAPVRASATDAQFYLQWIDELISKTSPGGEWSGYFADSLVPAQARYHAARAVFQQIANESGSPLAVVPTPRTEQPLALGAIHPNPSRGPIDVSFSIARSGPVRLSLFDLAGRHVRTLVDRIEPAGTHRASWDGQTAGGQPAAAGVYLLRCEAAGQIETRRIQRLR